MDGEHEQSKRRGQKSHPCVSYTHFCNIMHGAIERIHPVSGFSLEKSRERGRRQGRGEGGRRERASERAAGCQFSRSSSSQAGRQAASPAASCCHWKFLRVVVCGAADPSNPRGGCLARLGLAASPRRAAPRLHPTTGTTRAPPPGCPLPPIPFPWHGRSVGRSVFLVAFIMHKEDGRNGGA